MANHPHFQKYPRLKQNLVFHEPENIRSRLPFLFVDHLSQAQCPLAWAEELLGVSSKRTPQEMARLMGWKWSPEEPAFAGIPYEEVASWLGAVSPDHEILSRDQQIVKLKEQNDGLKGELKEVQAELRKTTKQQQRQDAFVRSLSGRMARGFYSVEKRVRSLFGGL
jgi:hypothetical protein